MSTKVIADLGALISEEVTVNTDVIAVQDSITEFTDVTVVDATNALNTQTTTKIGEIDAHTVTKLAEVQVVADSVDTAVTDAATQASNASTSASTALAYRNQAEASAADALVHVTATNEDQLTVAADAELIERLRDEVIEAETNVELLLRKVATYADLPATGVSATTYIVLADETAGGETVGYRWDTVAMDYFQYLGAGQSAAQIEALYESNPNTNKFSDIDKIRLDNLVAGGGGGSAPTKAEIDALGVDAATVNGYTVDVSVPTGAVFTDTTYSDLGQFANTPGYLTSASNVDESQLVGGYVHTDNNYTTIDKAKVDSTTLAGKGIVDADTSAEVTAKVAVMGATKVDTVAGKQLSTEDFTTTLKELVEVNKVKSVTTDAVNNWLVITYEDDSVINLNVSDVITDLYVDGASLDAGSNVLTLTSSNGGADVTVDLSDFVNSSELVLALNNYFTKAESALLYEPKDTTILKDADIGTTVQAYDANIVSDATYVATEENYSTVDKTKVDYIAVTQPVDLDVIELAAVNNGINIATKVAKVVSTDNSIVVFDGIGGEVRDSGVNISSIGTEADFVAALT